MKKRIMTHFLAAAALLWLLSACWDRTAPVLETEATPSPTAISTVTPSPKQTPTPTPVPSPSPTPYVFELYGVTVSSTDTFIDLSNVTIRSTEELENALPFLPAVEKIDMSFCGLDYSVLHELDVKYPDIRIVWTMYLDSVPVKTDDIAFIASVKYEPAIGDWNTWLLSYCPDLIALDLGHCEDVHDLSFLYSLPKLQYLILAECNVRDIGPIASLKELIYLEIFWTKCEDLSPLTECRKLLDLNICYIYARGDAAYEVLHRMTWLQRLWYCGSNMSQEQQDRLRKALPNCEMFLEPHGESTGGTWREHERYFAMRDAFGMPYMKGGIN